MFTQEQRTALESLGFVQSADLTTEVFYRQSDYDEMQYFVLTADGECYSLFTSDPEVSLGTY